MAEYILLHQNKTLWQKESMLKAFEERNFIFTVTSSKKPKIKNQKMKEKNKFITTNVYNTQLLT